MKIWISHKVSVDVSESVRSAWTLLQPAVERRLESVELKSPVETLAVFLVVMNPEMGQFPGRSYFSRREATFYADVNIDHQIWVASDTMGQISAAADALCSAIDDLALRHVSDAERTALKEAVRLARVDLEGAAA